jgi:hypothetical protein
MYVWKLKNGGIETAFSLIPLLIYCPIFLVTYSLNLGTTGTVVCTVYTPYNEQAQGDAPNKPSGPVYLYW